MKRIGVLITAGCLSLFLMCCTSGPDTVTVRIVATTDVHGHIFDKDCVSGSEREGSLAKFSTFLNRERKEQRNVIYLDAGDMLQGTIDDYHDQTAQFARECLPAKALNLLGCSATVMGNHDFAVGPNSYDRYFRGLDCPVLGANVFFEQYGDYLPPYRIMEVQGVRIAILGMTTPLVNYQLPADRRELDLADIVESAGYWMPVLKDKEKADVVIGLFHSGYDGGRQDEGLSENAVRKLIANVPGFDLIIYGHDHKARKLKTADCSGDSVLLLNPGPFMTDVAVATVTVTGVREGSPAVTASGDLVNITGEIPDARFLRKLSGWYDDLSRYADSVIGSVSAPIEADGMLWRRSSLMDFVHSMQMSFIGAEVSLAVPAFTASYFPAGEIRIKDLFGVYEFDNTMVSVMLRGSEIKAVLENSASQFYNTVTDANGGLLKLRQVRDGSSTLPRRPASGMVTAAGIRYDIDVTKPEGKRINIISMSDGKPFDPDRMYRTTINSNQYSGTTLPRVIGISTDDMRKRFNGSSRVDIRYYMITDLAIKKEAGMAVTVEKVTDWRLVPPETVAGCLARDTVGFNIIEKAASNN